MDETLGADVFVSYARADLRSDNPHRRSLPSVVQALRDRGLRVFLDTSEIDGFVSLNPTLTSAIERSKYVLAWYSPTYPTRPTCRAELTLALIAARAASLDRPVVLAVNTERDTGHIVHSEVLGQNMLTSPADGDAGAVAALTARIAEVVQADAKPIGLIETTPPRWYPSQVRGSARFVGRLREVWELDARLWPHRGSLDSGVLHEAAGIATCLVGLAGSGKTLLALEYARLLAPAYPGGVFWLPAGGRDDAPAQQVEIRLEAALRDIASALDIATDRLPLDKVRQEIFARIEADGRSCLWIVDDLPPGLDQPAVQRWLGPARSRTVITTQSTEYEFLTNVRLGAMVPLEALALLTAENPPAGDAERQAAETIVRVLDGHPMGLDIARAYLLHQRSYREFAERLRADSDADILERAGELSRRPSIQVVMLSSFSLLNADGLAALRVACAVPPLPVPESLIRSVAERSSDVANRDVELGISALLNLSLARRTEPGVIQLHSLVNRAARYLEPESVDKLRPMVASSLFYKLDGVTLVQLSGVRHEVRLARESYSDPKTPPDLWVHRAALRAEMLAGAFHSSLPAWQAQLRAADAIMGAASWEATIARCGLSEVLRELGRAEEALSVAEEALYWSERSHGWADTHTIGAAEVVGLALASVGRREEALKMFERIRSAYEALGARGAVGLARTRANLSALGKGEGLVALLNESIRSADAEALRTVVQLAPLEVRAGRPAVAARLLSQCLSRLVEMVGNDNPVTCECKVHLAQAHVVLEQYSQAEELLRGALAWYEKELGARHAKTIATRYQLMAVCARTGDRQVLAEMEAASAANQESARLFNAGERQAALAKAEEALSRTRDLFGAESPETILYLHNVAQIAGAVDVDRTATVLDELCQLLPADDERRKEEVELLALAANGAAAAARTRGDSASACRWGERSLQAQDELNGPRSETAVVAAWNLSMLLDEDGRRVEGMAMFIDRVSYLLAVDEETLSSDLQTIREAAGAKTRDSRTRSGARYNERQLTDDVMARAAERANAMTDAGTPWEALAEMQQLADEYARRYGSFHPKTLWVNFMLWISAGRLGEINHDSKGLGLAVEQLRLVGRAQRAQLGENHPAVLATFQNLAGLLQAIDPAEAARLDEQCLEMSRRVHGTENPTTVMIAINAVHSATRVGNYTGARSILHGYLRWLVERDAEGVPKELLQARAAALEAGQGVGVFARSEPS